METLNLTVRQFCDMYNISHSTFYRMKASGTGPRLMRLGKRIFIMKEHAKSWADGMEKGGNQ